MLFGHADLENSRGQERWVKPLWWWIWRFGPGSTMIGGHVGTLVTEIFDQKPWPSKRCAGNHGPAETIAQHIPKRCQASRTPGIEPGTSAFSSPRSEW